MFIFIIFILMFYGNIDVFKFIFIYILFEGELLNVFK